MNSQPVTASLPLAPATLRQLGVNVAVPRYDRRLSVSGIVHVGVGGFNRSHLCVYLDDLLAMQPASLDSGPRWGEFGVGLLPGDEQIHSSLAAQEFLYGVLERDGVDGGHWVRNYRVIGSLTGHAYAPAAPETVLQKMTAPECEIVSLTVTEGGYFLDDATRTLQANDAALLRDLENPAQPSTWLGFVAEAADRRMQSGGAPFTLLSCDNLHANGDAARTSLLAFAALRSDRLRGWIEANVAFPNSMVDRITPKTTGQDRVQIAEDFGVLDLSPVVTEPFRQWVLEDTFAARRPAFETVGVQMTTDAAPYEKTKMRLLNGGHLCIAYFAALLGIVYVADALADPLLRPLLEAFLAEVRPTLHDLPGIGLEEYSASIVQRFANQAIRDQITRICSGGCAKMSKFIVPTLRDLLAARLPTRMMELVIASWLYSSRGITEDGSVLPIDDQNASLLAAFLRSDRNASAGLGIEAVFGDLAVQHPALAPAVQQYLNHFNRLGVRATIAQALGRSSE